MLGFGARSSSTNQHKLIRAGAIFCHVHPDNLIEKARVISVAPGPRDIPHVRFAVSFERSRFHLFDDGPRLLSLLFRRVLSGSSACRRDQLSFNSISFEPLASIRETIIIEVMAAAQLRAT